MNDDQEYTQRMEAAMSDDLCAPWEIGTESGEEETQIINRFGQHVCTIAIDQLDRHAALIRSAPELLEALKRLRTATAAGFEDRDEAEEDQAWEQAEAAIAKATGAA